MWRAARPSWLKDMLLFNIECGTKILEGRRTCCKSLNNNCLSEPGACKQLEAGFFGVIAAELQEDLWTLGVGNLKWQTLEESLGYIQTIARLHASQRESTSFWWVQTMPLRAKHRCWIWKMTSASGNRFYFCLNVVQTNKMLLRFVFYAKGYSGYARCSRWAIFEWKIFKGGAKTLVKNLRNWFLHGCFFGSDRSSINSKRQCRRTAGPLKTRCNPWRWKSCNLCALCDVVALGMIKGNKWNRKDARFLGKNIRLFRNSIWFSVSIVYHCIWSTALLQPLFPWWKRAGCQWGGWRRTGTRTQRWWGLQRLPNTPSQERLTDVCHYDVYIL